MNMNLFFLASISYLIGFVFLLIIRSYDKYEKEPLGRLVLFSFLGGIVSVLVSSCLYFFVHPAYTFTDAILKVGTVEEFSKLATLFLLYKIIRKDFDEIVDGIIYTAAIALGFSVIENIFYAINADYSYTLLLKRFLFATIGHMAFSVYLGIAFYVHKKINRNFLGLFVAFILSTLAHGFYDGVLFNKHLTFLFIPVYLLLIYYQFRLLKVAYAYSRMKTKLNFENLNKQKKNLKLECCHCRHDRAEVYRLKDIDIAICENCGNTMIYESDFNKILKFYRPKLNRKQFFNFLNKSLDFLDDHSDQVIYYHNSKQRFNTNLTSLRDWLQEQNTADLVKYHQTVEGRIFKQLGFKYLKINE